MVGCALGVTEGERTRRVWDWVDHEYLGKKIEVKATGFTQRRRQGKKRSPPSFDIAKHVCVKWGEPAAKPGAQIERSADCYVFCIHTDKEAVSANALDLNHWEFLVISKEKLNQTFGDQKSVTCRVLEKHCIKTGVGGLRKAVDTCIGK